MKFKLNHRIKQKLSTSVSMLAPEVGSLCTHGADYMARQPRQTSLTKEEG